MVRTIAFVMNSSDLDVLSSVVSELYQEVQNNKAMINHLAKKLQGGPTIQWARESVPEPDEGDEVKPNGRDLAGMLKCEEIARGAVVRATLPEGSVIEWEEKITLPPGAQLIVSCEGERKAKLVMSSNKLKLCMRLSSSFVLRNVDIVAKFGSGVLFEIDGSKDGVGVSSVRFENVSFETEATVLNVGLHGWCHLVLKDATIIGNGKMYTQKYGTDDSGSVVTVVETKSVQQ